MEANTEAGSAGPFFEALPWPAWLVLAAEPHLARGNELAARRDGRPEARLIAVDALAELFEFDPPLPSSLSQRIADVFASAGTGRFPGRWRAAPERRLSLVLWSLPAPGGATAVAVVALDGEGPDLGQGCWRRLGHDLRGPIAPIRMAVQLLQRGGIGAAEQEGSLRMIDRQIDRLLAVIDAQAELMRLHGSGTQAAHAAQDLNLVLDVVSERGTIGKALAAKQQSLHCRPLAREVLVDHDQAGLIALVEFLVGKAIEQAPPGTALTLSLEAIGDRARLHLSGMPAELTADAEFAHVAGVGAPGNDEPSVRPVLMREIARRHGVRFEPSGPGEGLVFSLPLSATGGRQG